MTMHCLTPGGVHFVEGSLGLLHQPGHEVFLDLPLHGVIEVAAVIQLAVYSAHETCNPWVYFISPHAQFWWHELNQLLLAYHVP